MVVISLGEEDLPVAVQDTPSQSQIVNLDGPAPLPVADADNTYDNAFVVPKDDFAIPQDQDDYAVPQDHFAVDEDPMPMLMERSISPALQKGDRPSREGTAASRPDREGTTASRVSNMSREEIIEELEAVEAQLNDTAAEKETWKSKCNQAESEYETLKREATEEMEHLRVQASEELKTWKSQCHKAEGALAVVKRQLTPQKLGVPADEFEAFLHGPEPTKAEKKVGRCLTNRKFIILMLYLNLLCGAAYLYILAVQQATDESFQPRPSWLVAVDWAFLGIFVLAMLLRLLVFRLNLRGFWTVLEFALLPLFIIEQALSANSDSLIDEMTIPRNTLQGLRIIFVLKLVPVLIREFRAWRSKHDPQDPLAEQLPAHQPLP